MAKKNCSELLTQKRGPCWFALCAIAVLQLSSALHQFEHGAAYIEANCKI